MNPEVSVIIPVFNCESYIGDAIESVLRQSYRKFEILVIDDGSTDRSAEIAASYPEVRLFRKHHEGVASARNFGITKAEADLVAFLDADDLYSDDKLAKQTDYMAAHPECSIVFSDYRNFTDIPKDRMTDRQRAVLHEYVSQCLPAACIRKEVFSKFGLFDTSYPYAEDTEFFMRLAINRINLSHRIGEVLYLRRVHEDNATLQHADAGRNEMYGILMDAVRNRRRKMKKTSDTPLISVIMPAWNAEAYIEEAIRSVRTDTPERVQIIVVDDGSDDATSRIAQEFGCQVFRKGRGGAASARNLGLTHANGEMILFLDADDRLTEGAVDRLLSPMQEDSSVCAVFAKAVDFISPELGDEEAARLRPRTEPYEGILPGCSLIRRKVFDTIGAFDSSLNSGETVEWMMKLRASGLPFMKIEDVTLERRLHLNNTGRRKPEEELKNYAAIIRRRMKKAGEMK